MCTFAKAYVVHIHKVMMQTKAWTKNQTFRTNISVRMCVNGDISVCAISTKMLRAGPNVYQFSFSANLIGSDYL